MLLGVILLLKTTCKIFIYTSALDGEVISSKLIGFTVNSFNLHSFSNLLQQQPEHCLTFPMFIFSSLGNTDHSV